MRNYSLLVLTLLYSSLMAAGTLHAADPILPLGDEDTQFSLGVDNLPWNADQVAFRWWNNSRGKEFSMGYFTLTYREHNPNMQLKAAGVRYVWLRRDESNRAHRIHITRGFGLSTVINLSEEKVYVLNLRTHLPFGIEHYFLKEYPGVSYSLEADFFGELKIVSDSNYSLSLGVTPRFFLRIYFN